MNTVKPEPIVLFCLAPGDAALARRLAAMLPVTCLTSEKLLEEGFIPFKDGFTDTVHEAFANCSALVFVDATGIAVRVLAPLVNDKSYDPVVVVIDERIQHVISLLSGHAGGTNALVCYLAGMLGADLIITTVADVNDMTTPDTLAFQLNARMSDFRSAMKIVNQMLVSNKRVSLWRDDELTQDTSYCDRRGFIMVTDLSQLLELDALACIALRTNLPDLPAPHWKLVLQRVAARIGRRHDAPFPLLAALFTRQLETQQPDPLALKAIGGITLKEDEQGLIRPASCCRALFETFTADALREHEHHFPASSFVHKTVGAGSVSGSTIWLLDHGKLLGETLREQGVTITLGVSH